MGYVRFGWLSNISWLAHLPMNLHNACLHNDGLGIAMISCRMFSVESHSSTRSHNQSSVQSLTELLNDVFYHELNSLHISCRSIVWSEYILCGSGKKGQPVKRIILYFRKSSSIMLLGTLCLSDLPPSICLYQRIIEIPLTHQPIYPSGLFCEPLTHSFAFGAFFTSITGAVNKNSILSSKSFSTCTRHILFLFFCLGVFFFVSFLSFTGSL